MSAVSLSDFGLVSALGCGKEETLKNLLLGRRENMKEISLAGGEISFFGFTPLSPEAFAAAPTRVAALLDAAARELNWDALYAEVDPRKVGAVVGTSNSTMEEFTENPDTIDMAYPAERLREVWGVRGPAYSVSTACSSSAKAFMSARRLLEEGICDAVIVGGADAKTRTVIEGFHALESLAAGHTKPLSDARDGINLGEGAALFVMRRLGESRTKKDDIFLLGVGESSDAYHLTAPDPEGRGAERAMRLALEDASLNPGDIDYVNLHGTGTRYNDAMECAAVRRVFGSRVPVSSTKPLTGHCLGAAGAIEAALSALVLQHGRGLPPHVIDAEVDRALAPFPIPRVGDETPVRTILSNAFAFGGSNASLILSRARKGDA